MPDPFRALPSELDLLILRWLDLPSLYCALKAFPSLAETFNAYTAFIIESSIRHYPLDIQRCIRTIVTLAKLPGESISLEVFTLFYLQGEASEERLVNLTPSNGHHILEKAWQIHWVTEYSLNDSISRTEKARAAIKPDLPGSPLPASWIEEQRFLRAWWRFQVWTDVASAKSNFPQEQIRKMTPTRLWRSLSAWEVEELLTIMNYDIDKNDEEPDKMRLPIDGYTGLRQTSSHKCFFFTEDIVQSTWPIRRPSEDYKAFFCQQDEIHIRFAAPGFRTKYYLHASRLLPDNAGTPDTWHMGLFIWDKRRMARLGFVEMSSHHSVYHPFPDGIFALDSTSLAGAWAAFELAGVRGLVSWYLEDPGTDLD